MKAPRAGRPKSRKRYAAGLTAAALAAGSAPLLLSAAEPAHASLCTGRMDCRSAYPSGSTCNATAFPPSVTNNPITVPGSYPVTLEYSSYCRTIYAISSSYSNYDGGTLAARSYNQGNLYSDSLNLPAVSPVHIPGDSCSACGVASYMADDQNVTGFAMGWSGSQWYKTGSY